MVTKVVRIREDLYEEMMRHGSTPSDGLDAIIRKYKPLELEVENMDKLKAIVEGAVSDAMENVR